MAFQLIWLLLAVVQPSGFAAAALRHAALIFERIELQRH